MKVVSLLVAGSLLVVGGCASTHSEKSAHVLSGQAPVETIVRQADEAVQKGDDEAAAVLYHQALSQQPDADTWYRLGATLTRLEQGADPQWAFRNALSLEPDHVPSLQAVGFYLTTQDRPEEARPYLQRLLAQSPENWRAHNALGVLADLEGNFAEASDHYAAAIEQNPESPMLWNNLGYSYYMDGDHDAAIRHIGKALQIDPGYRSARFNVALVFARQSRYDDALQMMLSASDEAQAYCDVGYLAYKMGDYDTAERLLTEAIQRSGTYYRQAHRNLAAVRQAQANERG